MKVIQVTSWDNKSIVIPVDQILFASEDGSGSEIALDTAFGKTIRVKEDILEVKARMEKPEGEED